MANDDELSQLRFIASAPRPLVREKDATALSALDAKQKIAKRKGWNWEYLAIVCKTGDPVVTNDTSEAIAAIEANGGPVGLVGVAVIDRQFHYLKKPLAKGAHVKARLEAAAKAAEKDAWERVRESFRQAFREGGLDVVKAEKRDKK